MLTAVILIFITLKTCIAQTATCKDDVGNNLDCAKQRLN
ncbi:hypothetical protein T02_10980 [Trichinella nativa]|uniref:Uncharacterized protein n=1 Tax=Trichinella nativa TaxID=6335 RepID=A0A0V1KK02_9BILA|nr:hypothetical protein T02_10980 [Trichinella nativa]